MVSEKKSRIVPAKTKKGGVRQNTHVFHGFHERVAKLTINPVQKARQQDERATESYLKARLEFWKDTNLSKNFVEFTRSFEPLCDSLVQILHNEQRIFDLLVAYIGREDEHSLEPFLDLLGQFAHDLGLRFEKYFALSLKTIVALVSGHQAIEVVEWSFNSLAWLFQYLSKLLVPDLRPTYDILAPLLGKQVRKEHIARFAAEALSFLIRKAASRFQRDATPLNIVVKHMLGDWSISIEETNTEDVYGYGLMIVFADAIKDTKASRSIKATGLPVYRVLLQESYRLAKTSIALGVTTSLMHHTQANTFSDILATAVEEIKALNSDVPTDCLLQSCELIYNITVVRKGNRVSDWNAIFEASDHIVELMAPRSAAGAIFSSLPTLMLASIIQVASFDAVVPRLQRSVEMLSDIHDLFSFPHFCLYAWEINPSRFHELLKPYMFRYMAKYWDDGNVRLLFSAQTIVKSDSATSRVLAPSARVHFKDWPEQIASRFENYDAWKYDNDQIRYSDVYLDLATLLSPESQMGRRTAKAIEDLLLGALQELDVWSLTGQRLVIGGCMSWHLKQPALRSIERTLIIARLLDAQHDHCSMPLYLQNLLQIPAGEDSVKLTNGIKHELLIRNLSTDSQSLRLASLQLLKKVYHLTNGSDSAALNAAIEIENTAADHQSLRTISMHISRFEGEYAASTNHPWIGKAIVRYLFGVLTIKLAPVWNDAINTLKHIYDSNQGDGVQLLEDIAFEWLETRHSEQLEPQSESAREHPSGPVNEFQCTNARLWRSVFDSWGNDLAHSEVRLTQRFSAKHKDVHLIPSNSPSQALRVLNAIPALAERRSRRLVPLFLKWASAEEDPEATLLGDGTPDSNDDKRPGLSYKDQRAMLDIFGLFQNPSVLHQSAEVYNALLRLLGNGDVGLQKSALKALFAWKLPGVKRYHEELSNLLDNARFREEMTIFLPNQSSENRVPSTQRRELMRVLLRLLYGRIIARGAAGAGNSSQTARRKAVFESLGAFPDEDLTAFIDIILGPLKNLVLDGDRIIPEDLMVATQFPIRKQMGFVRLTRDLFDSLGDKLQPHAEHLLNALLFCLEHAKNAQDDPDESNLETDPTTNMSSMQKAVRQGALQSMLRLFKSCKTLDTQRYAGVIDSIAITPRLGQRFVSENAQSISSMLQLLSVWALKTETATLLFVNAELLPRVLECLGGRSSSYDTKPEVKIFIFEHILKPLVAKHDDDLKCRLTSAGLYELILQKSSKVIQGTGSKELLASAVSTILEVAKSRNDKGEDHIPKWSASLALELVQVFSTLLSLANQVVSPQTKTSALTVLAQILPSFPIEERDADALKELLVTLSKMFQTSKDAGMRLQLSRTFEVAAILCEGHAPYVAKLCCQLNAFSMNRLEDPDYDERERAFEAIAAVIGLSDADWSPLVYNALFFIGDHEELVIRKGASRILRRFIETNAKIEQVKDTKKFSPTSKLMRGVLLPALRRGVSERSELVRLEYLSVMEHLISCCPEWSEIKDLAILTTATEENESFFDSILHIQQDRRKNCLLKLAKHARQGQLGNDSIAHYLLPLVQQFVLDRADDDNAHSLAAQSVLTIGALVSSLEWVHARKTLRHYTGIIKNKPELEKAVIRLIGVTTEAIFNASTSDISGPLKSTIPPRDDLASDIGDILLPPLVSFLHHKDETVVSLRVPVAVSAARLTCLLPDNLLEYKLAPILTDVCNILRSKAQESRDLSRKTLSEIAALIGPHRFAFILKELRIALSRGKQLHVLSYTLHSLLVQSTFKPGDLDYCLPEIMRVVLDDIFGATGQEKDADGYTSKAKEVKGSKSLDTAERMAKIATIEHLKDFITPVQRLLIERLDSRGTAKMDELLRRIRSGLEMNEAIGTQQTLVFCFEVLQQAKITAADSKHNKKVLTLKEQQQRDTFEIKTKGARKAPILPQISSQQYKLARFALDLLREVLRRHEELKTPANITGFLVPVGDVLIDAQEEVQVSALRFLASIMKTQLKDWVNNAPVYASTAYKALRNQPNTNTELSQAALKLLTAIIKDRPETVLKDSQLSWLIKAVIPDLTQPASQGVSFNFLKALIQRHIVINEVYEAMDALAKLFITYGDGGARNQGRSIWLQFVTTYEQSEKRFDQQIAFMIRNLEYEHSEGRQSVMEAIHFLLGKLDEDHLQKAILALFIPVMSRFISDSAATCREFASLLLKSIISHSDDTSLQTIRKALQNYLGRDDKDVLRTAALQVYASFVEVDSKRGRKDLPFLIQRLQSILDDAADGVSEDWELPCHALRLMAVLCETYDSEIHSPKLQQLWTTVYQFSAYPHAWVKHAAAKLLRKQFSNLDVAASDSNTLKTVSGLTINHEQLCNLVRSYFGTMLRRDVQKWLVEEVTENLKTLTTTVGDVNMAQNSIANRQDDAEGDEADEDEEEDGDEEDDENDGQAHIHTIRGYSLRRISAIIRRRESPLVAKHAALDLSESIVDNVSNEALVPLLKDILPPLNHLTDSMIANTMQVDNAAMALQDDLTTRSNELISKLQRKLPSDSFVSAMHKVQQETKQRREERSGKRRIQRVTDPEKYAKDKIKKRVREHERRKERNSIHRSKRVGY